MSASHPGSGWDPMLYAGSAAYYLRGRVPYPTALVEVLVEELGLDGTGRLLDLGCGPGSLTVPLAPYVAEAVGVDPDVDMLTEAQRHAAGAAVSNARWLRARGEDVTSAWGRFRAVTLAQSFHWMDRERVSRLLPQVLGRDGALAFVHATTHEGVAHLPPTGQPAPPRAEIEELVRSHLGPRRRACAGTRSTEVATEGERGRIEAGYFRAAGFVGPTRREVPGWIVTRTVDDVVASVFSLSYAAPHLFADRLPDFERDLRSLLERSATDGVFEERMREIAVDVWRLPADSA